MNELIMLIGLPGSGKTYYANSLLDSGFLIFSSDQIREELFGDESVQGNNNDIFNILHKRIEKALYDHKNVIYDATNLSYKKRKSFLEQINSINCKKICTVIATPYEDCKNNNKQRSRIVPDEVIENMYEHFNFPIYSEGWDYIGILFNDKKYDYTKYNNYFLDSMNTISQDNPHHQYTIGNHMIACQKYLVENFRTNHQLQTAARLHDIGKQFTKTFINTHGEKTDTAHYYNHENVGSYLAMMYLHNQNISVDDIVLICTYIQWHMQLYFCKSEKLINKYRKFWGRDLYGALKMLNIADKLAH